MFLQDLIRNVVLYKGVMQPFIESWRESLSTLYVKQNLHYVYQISDLPLPRNKKRKPRFSLYCNTTTKITEISLFEISGTRTITDIKSHTNKNYDFYRDINELKQSATGNNMIAVLASQLYGDDVVISDKSASYHTQTSADFVTLSSSHTYSTTTGLAKINVNTFLSLETHEKREYLGEFSLTHEEIPLMYLKRGGDEHAINEKPVAASF